MTGGEEKHTLSEIAETVSTILPESQAERNSESETEVEETIEAPTQQQMGGVKFPSLNNTWTPPDFGFKLPSNLSN